LISIPFERQRTIAVVYIHIDSCRLQVLHRQEDSNQGTLTNFQHTCSLVLSDSFHQVAMWWAFKK
jgi:hypothetical protein